MRKLLWLLTGLVIFAGCQQTPSNLCQVTGTVLNPDSTVFMAYIDGTRDTIDLNEDGTFLYELESEKAKTIMLLYGRNNVSVYVAPGNTVDVMLDVADWNNSKSFSGDLTAENSYMLEKSDLASEWRKNSRAMMMKEPTAYRASRDSMQDVYMAFLEGYEDLTNDFVEVEMLTLEFGYYGDLNNYPRAHKYYTKVEDLELPEGWDDFMESIDINNPLLMEVPAAMRFVTNIVNDGAIEEAGLSNDAWGTPELLNAKIAYIEKHITVAEMKEKMIFDLLNQQLDSGPPTGVEEAIDSYLASTSNEENKSTLQGKVDNWAAILPGQPAPGFNLPDIDGENLALADLAGKYVYIDFWATWCGPCIAEIPHYRELVKDYADRNVVFMSISVDRDKEAWEKMVEEEAFEWLQLHDSVNMNDDYLVRYIPTFVFVDTEGKIIDPRAPRPSTEALRELLDAQPGL